MNGLGSYPKSPFFVAHLLVWLLAGVLLVTQWWRVRAIRRFSSSIKEVTESEFQRHTYPIERLDQLFEYCGSAFVLLGLVGTMVGFIDAVPELQKPDYDFHHFREALTVSAFGIVWSLVLTGLVSLHHSFVVSPMIEELLAKRPLDSLAATLAQELNRFGEHVSANLSQALVKFAVAAEQIAGASNQLASKAEHAGQSFAASAQAISSTASAVADIHARARDLPTALSSGLATVFSQQNSGLQSTFDGQTQSLQKAFSVQVEQLRSHAEAAQAGAAGLSNATRALVRASGDTVQTTKAMQATVDQANAGLERLGTAITALVTAFNRFDSQHLGALERKVDKALAAAGRPDDGERGGRGRWFGWK